MRPTRFGNPSLANRHLKALEIEIARLADGIAFRVDELIGVGGTPVACPRCELQRRAAIAKQRRRVGELVGRNAETVKIAA